MCITCNGTGSSYKIKKGNILYILLLFYFTFYVWNNEVFHRKI
jgi:hypothetical protein